MIISVIVIAIVIIIIAVLASHHQKGADATGQAVADQTQATDNQGVTTQPTDSSLPSNTSTMDQATQNLQAGQAFLATNKTKSGVVTTASGLQYKVLTMGTGPKPSASNTVQVNYEGRLIDGTVFDSSYKRGEPIEFPLSGVIAGWTEGVQLMPTGSKFEFYIPANLAYGAGGAGGAIGPNETLIFDVELLKIVK